MEELQKVGLFIDDIYRLRVEEPSLAGEKIKVKQECLKYSKNLTIFKKLANDFCKVSELLAKDVDREKLCAIGNQNQLKTISNQRQSEQQVYRNEIFEQTVELERLKSELQYLQRIETEQNEIINNFFVNHY
ncbi:intraflagellar transport protein 20 homolog [Drosophila rhopaloa]|uniref:Intraflagellar transport protein 20 homolog n=1 Tax=Drosophila rhopaloa TaxID=1041015 RepID=A0A6P4EGE0_DRORH|nr:intraflagellar transport protein 20 homolog [Drosophila rhopaloa]